MKTAIVYSTKHGTTQKVATMIRDLAPADTELFNLNEVKDVDLAEFDCIILGGSIHAGTIQKSINKFCAKHMQELTTKPLGLFLSCLDEEKAAAQFNTAYPEVLRQHARSSKLTGGEALYERMNFVERLLMKKISGKKESFSRIDRSKVEELASEMFAEV